MMETKKQDCDISAAIRIIAKIRSAHSKMRMEGLQRFAIPPLVAIKAVQRELLPDSLRD